MPNFASAPNLAPPLEAGTITLSTFLLGDLQVFGSPDQTATLQALATRARGNGTQRIYRSVWHGDAAWCTSLGRQPLAGDPETTATYAVHAADRGLSLSSLLALDAIQAARSLAGIARTKDTRLTKQATAAGPDVLRRMLATTPDCRIPQC